jgi:AhpC/TSA family
MQLAHYRGKVVAIEFLFVRSAHCLRLVELLNKLNSDLGPRGFQAIGVAFGPNSDAAVLTHMVEYFKLNFPVGFTSRDKVDAYLGREGTEVLKIPQIVVIDRKGMIRATSGANGNPLLEDEKSLRDFVDTLLKENGPAAKAQSKPVKSRSQR